MQTDIVRPPGTARACDGCATELSAQALACPACHALVHRVRLEQLAARAEALELARAPAEARTAWAEALEWLPASSRQHAQVTARITELEAQVASAAMRRSVAPGATRPWWKSPVVGIAGIALLAASKLKLLVVGLTKAKTFVSMFAFFGVYWSAFGWPLALGLVLAIYVHEMGHVAMLRRLGIGADAPLFVPGVGAFVMLKQPVSDPRANAAIGLAGPVWGFAAGLVAMAVHRMTGEPIWIAIAQLTGFVNLFNLMPVWQLDGARGFHALDRIGRLLVVLVMAAAFAVTGQKLLLLLAGVAAWSAFRLEPGPGDRRTLMTFAALVAALSWLAGQAVIVGAGA